MTAVKYPESRSLLADEGDIKWVEEPNPSSFFASSRRTLLVMLLASLVFLSGLALALAAPLHKRQSSSPVIGTNFQDPAVLQLDDGTWIAYAGVNNNPVNINVLTATSADFTTWVVHDEFDAFPTLPSWAASPGHVWAPDVVQLVRKQAARLANPVLFLCQTGQLTLIGRQMAIMCYTIRSPWHQVQGSIVLQQPLLPVHRVHSYLSEPHHSSVT